MTRNDYINKCKDYLNTREGTPYHKIIIDNYNHITPLPVGYKMTYKDPWCACFLSSCAFMLNDKSFPYECSAERMRKKAKVLNEPYEGCLIFFGNRYASHVGLVTKITKTYIFTIEGNANNSVLERKYKLDDAKILSYGAVSYDKEKNLLPDIAIIKEVIQGKWGNGEERIKRLTDAGYNAKKIQKAVNNALK